MEKLAFANNVMVEGGKFCQYSEALKKKYRIVCFGGTCHPDPTLTPWRVVVRADIAHTGKGYVRSKVFVLPPTTKHDVLDFMDSVNHTSSERTESWKPHNYLIYGKFFWREDTLRDRAVVERFVPQPLGYAREALIGLDGKTHPSGRQLSRCVNKNDQWAKIRGRRGEYRHFIEKPGPDSVVLVSFRENTGFTWDGRAWTREIEATWKK